MTTLTAHVSAECANGYPEACTDPGCVADEHLPDRDDGWTAVDEDASWLAEDAKARRRS